MKETTVQNSFLDRLKEERRSVEVITINGFHIEGLIADHDQYTILMDVNGRQQLVYKSAVSTIVRKGV